jgi:His/Glu/Gln/Arg/opine family amino acid ABC transporter permease subunit
VAPVKGEKIQVTDSLLVPERDETSVFSAWRITFFGAIGLLVILPLVSPDPYRKIIEFLPDGIVQTFEVTVLSILFATVVGLITGIGRISRIRIVNRIATIYVEVIRGIPLLVQLFYIYFALGTIVQLPRVTAAVVAMTICYGAYMGEIFRAGIQAVPRGQMEAALALGLTRGQALRHPAPDHPDRPAADRQRVHRAAQGLFAGLDHRGFGPPAAGKGVRLEDLPLFRVIHRGRAVLPGDDALLLAPRRDHGREAFQAWVTGSASSTRASASAGSKRCATSASASPPARSC